MLVFSRHGSYVESGRMSNKNFEQTHQKDVALFLSVKSKTGKKNMAHCVDLQRNDTICHAFF